MIKSRKRSFLSFISLLFSACSAVSVLISACEKTPPSELKSYAIQCMRDNDLECAERRWSEYLDEQPNDAEALASIGIVQSMEGEDKDAVSNLQKAISLGEGTYDLFSAYAQSLGRLGKTDDAIDWSYKALTVVPSLVDVRGNLAKLLVQKKRYYEALTLLAAFDEHLAALGQPPYFDGQRIAIESAMQQTSPARLEEQSQIRLFKMDGNFMAPVTMGEARVSAFVVDTGATITSVSDKLLEQSKTHYEALRSSVLVKTADGRMVRARLINIDSMKLGGFVLKDVSALSCANCQLLLGQATLSKFDFTSSKVQGVEFLTLKPRT